LEVEVGVSWSEARLDKKYETLSEKYLSQNGRGHDSSGKNEVLSSNPSTTKKQKACWKYINEFTYLLSTRFCICFPLNHMISTNFYITNVYTLVIYVDF
jgi:hypothetical protein